MRVTRRRRGKLAAIAAFCTGLSLITLGLTSGLAEAQPPPITDVSGYPPALPAGCNADGSSILTGTQFTANGQTVANMRDLPAPTPGTPITMAWTGFAPGCESAGISLSIKISAATTFVASDNQYLHSFDYCGPADVACTTNSLSIQMPAATLAPCWQLDAAIDVPLAVVGPGGSFYGQLNGTRNMLIGALNGPIGAGDCTPPPCPSNPAIPAGAVTCAPVVPCATNPALAADDPNCIPSPRPTTPCTSNPTIGATDPACRPCALDSGIDAADPRCTPCATNPQIPAGSPNCAPPPVTPPCQVKPSVPADDPTCVPCPTNPQLPADSTDCLPSTLPTTPPTTPPPTNPPPTPCAVNPAIPASDANCVPCATNSALPASSPDCLPSPRCQAGFTLNAGTNQCVAVSAGAARLPVTGSSTSEGLAITGGLFLLLGSMLLGLVRRETDLVSD